MLSKSLNEVIKNFFSLRKTVDKAMDAVEKRVDKIIEKIVKAIVKLLIVIVGSIFFIIGLASFFEAKTGAIAGTGFLVFGGLMLILAILVNKLQ